MFPNLVLSLVFLFFSFLCVLFFFVVFSQVNDHHRRGALRYRSLGSSGGSGGSGGMPTLFLDDVTSTSVTIGWWLDPDWVQALNDAHTSIEIQVEMAQVSGG